MFMRRCVLLAASLVAPLALSGCGKNKSTESTQSPEAETAGAVTPALTPTPPPVAQERIVVSGHLEGVDDMMAAFKKFGESYMPDSAVDPQTELQAALLGMGYGPGFLGNVDLSGMHRFSLASPISQSEPQDQSLSASIAVIDARKMIESFPQSQRPSPLGEGMWEMMLDSTRLLMQEQGKELLLGLSTQDIGAAATLRGQTQPGLRFRVEASNIPTDDFDPNSIMGMLPLGPKLSQDLGEVMRELQSVIVELDTGTTRDTQFKVGALAPFSKLGLDPIGGPRTAATSLESRLPAHPVFVTTMSWGDPRLLHTLVNSLPLDEVPDPIRGMVDKVIASTHTLLDQIANDVVVGLYLDQKGQATVLFAADVKDDAQAKKALQTVHEVINEGVQTQATMAGNNKNGAFSAKLALDSVKVSGGRADQITIKIPTDFEREARQVKTFLRKGSLEAISHVSQGTAIMLVGAGARPMITDIAKTLGKSRKTSLAQDTGLASIRTTMGGCQVCMTGDPLEYFRLRLLLARDQADQKAIVKESTTKLNALRKIEPIGLPGAGIKVEADHASMATRTPQTLVFAPPKSVATLQQINEFVDDPSSVLTEAVKQ